MSSIELKPDNILYRNGGGTLDTKFVLSNIALSSTASTYTDSAPLLIENIPSTCVRLVFIALQSEFSALSEGILSKESISNKDLVEILLLNNQYEKAKTAMSFMPISDTFDFFLEIAAKQKASRNNLAAQLTYQEALTITNHLNPGLTPLAKAKLAYLSVDQGFAKIKSTAAFDILISQSLLGDTKHTEEVLKLIFKTLIRQKYFNEAKIILELITKGDEYNYSHNDNNLKLNLPNTAAASLITELAYDLAIAYSKSAKKHFAFKTIELYTKNNTDKVSKLIKYAGVLLECGFVGKFLNIIEVTSDNIIKSGAIEDLRLLADFIVIDSSAKNINKFNQQQCLQLCNIIKNICNHINNKPYNCLIEEYLTPEEALCHAGLGSYILVEPQLSHKNQLCCIIGKISALLIQNKKAEARDIINSSSSLDDLISNRNDPHYYHVKLKYFRLLVNLNMFSKADMLLKSINNHATIVNSINEQKINLDSSYFKLANYYSSKNRVLDSLSCISNINDSKLHDLALLNIFNQLNGCKDFKSIDINHTVACNNSVKAATESLKIALDRRVFKTFNTNLFNVIVAISKNLQTDTNNIIAEALIRLVYEFSSKPTNYALNLISSLADTEKIQFSRSEIESSAIKDRLELAIVDMYFLIITSAQSGSKWSLYHKLAKTLPIDNNYKHVLTEKVQAAWISRFKNLENAYYQFTLQPLHALKMHELFKALNLNDITLPWGNWLSKISGLQAPASNLKHDLWSQELVQLILNITTKRKQSGTKQDILLDTSSEKDGKMLYEYIKRFGMLNLPYLFNTFAKIYNTKNLTRLYPPPRKSSAIKSYFTKLVDIITFPKSIFDQRYNRNSSLNPQSLVNLHQLLGRRKPYKSNTEILNDLCNYTSRLQAELIKGRKITKDEADSPLFMELFKTIIGTSEWQSQDSLEDVLKVYIKNQDEIKISSFHEEKIITVNMTDNYGSESSLRTPRQISEAVKKQFLIFKKSFSDLLEYKFIENVINTQKSGLQAELKKVQQSFLLSRLSASDINRISFKINLLESQLTQLNGLRCYSVTDAIEQLSDLKQAEFEESLTMLVLYKAFQSLNKKYSKKLINALQNWDEEGIKIIADWLLNHLHEHFLGKDRAIYLSDYCVQVVSDKLLLNQIENNPILILANQILSEQNRSISDATENIHLVPNKTLLHVYTGEIADACYTSKHLDLADGKYPDITSYLFVQNRNTPNEAIKGSFLLVEAKTESGQKVLILRGNNPRESLTYKLHKASLVKATINSCIEIAESGNFDYLVIPLDGQGKSSSNRDFVSKYYNSNFYDHQKLQLEPTPATAFNGYENYNSYGEHPVVIVWERAKN